MNVQSYKHCECKDYQGVYPLRDDELLTDEDLAENRLVAEVMFTMCSSCDGIAGVIEASSYQEFQDDDF